VWATKLFVRVAQENHLAIHPRRLTHRLDPPETLHQPALHVEDPGSPSGVPVHRDRHCLEGPGRPDGIVVPEQNDRRFPFVLSSLDAYLVAGHAMS
jgi:hypothetical protein